MEPVTSGPQVNESLETSISGIFACGNVLHVHDLVDYVSEEAALAGKNAVKYISAMETGETEPDQNEAEPIHLVATEGVRYTVPAVINVNKMEDSLIVRFRVGNVFQDSFISVYFDEERVIHRKKKIMAPGEMEEIKLQRVKLRQFENLRTITVKIEKE